jgi:hypothetical protein
MKSQTRRHRRRGKGSKTLRTSGGAFGVVKDILRTGRNMSSFLSLGFFKGNESKTKEYKNSHEFNEFGLGSRWNINKFCGHTLADDHKNEKK